MILSESRLRLAMIVFWRARIASALRSAERVGAPRRIAAFRFFGLPARAVPNSFRIRAKRSLNGSRSVFCTRSFWTVVWVCATGTQPLSYEQEVVGSPFASGSSLFDCPGWQSRKYSAISDWGWEEQVASWWNCDSGPLTLTVTTAFLAALTSKPVTVPDVTPAI